MASKGYAAAAALVVLSGCLFPLGPSELPTIVDDEGDAKFFSGAAVPAPFASLLDIRAAGIERDGEGQYWVYIRVADLGAVDDVLREYPSAWAAFAARWTVGPRDVTRQYGVSFDGGEHAPERPYPTWICHGGGTSAGPEDGAIDVAADTLRVRLSDTVAQGELARGWPTKNFEVVTWGGLADGQDQVRDHAGAHTSTGMSGFGASTGDRPCDRKSVAPYLSDPPGDVSARDGPVDDPRAAVLDILEARMENVGETTTAIGVLRNITSFAHAPPRLEAVILQYSWAIASESWGIQVHATWRQALEWRNVTAVESSWSCGVLRKGATEWEDAQLHVDLPNGTLRVSLPRPTELDEAPLTQFQFQAWGRPDNVEESWTDWGNPFPGSLTRDVGAAAGPGWEAHCDVTGG